MTTWMSQAIAITVVNLRSLPRRLAASAVAVFGIAGVVVVLVSVLSIAQGFRTTLQAGGDPLTAIVMSSGSEEMASSLSRETVQLVKDAPGILRRGLEPLASAELLVIVNHPKKSTGTTANVPLRGVEPPAFGVRRQARIVEGRSFEPGRNELVVGRAAARQFEALELGRSVQWGTNTWTTVGIFEAGGAIWESELWCDVTVLQPAYRRPAFNSVHVRLESPESFATLKDSLTKDPRLDVAVFRETDYYAEQSKATTRLITTLGFAIATLMAAGAVFGAVHDAHRGRGADARDRYNPGSRIRRSARRCVGARRTVALAVLGGLLGGSLAWILLDGYQTTTLNWQTYTQVAFAFAVTPDLLVEGVVYAIAIGMVGGLCRRCTRRGSRSRPLCVACRTTGP